eukprot:TRINITY_DN20565_c0_g1_i1.p1 TRINITY_DN20565_c0_g1~~TRINITY_DN20565_c0_g1_i1.p1  ORF type:complete len:512 (+),score=202.30 TRINITY_DN20565_c0_g1_i1:257-1792(+)
MQHTARSSTGSRGSRLSSKRSNYKLLSRTSEVDETLFASSQPKGRPRSTQGQASYVSKEMMASFQDATVIGSAELERLRASAVVRTHEMEMSETAAAKAQKDKAMSVAKARKDKIIAMEVERKKKEAKSDLELEAVEKEKHQLSRADFLVDEQRDDVKKMNQYVKYAKCAAIRDAQLEEKKALQRQQEEEDMHMDHQMEEERGMAVDLYQRREQQRHVDRIHGKEVIVEQIAARERERLLQQGLLEQERDAMLRQLERLKEEDLLKQEMKKEAAKKLMSQVSDSNSQMTKLKELKRQREREEDAKIAQYLKDKSQREQEHQEMLDSMAAEKEAECAALRAQQEKETDKKAELDALRAKRAMEQYERDWRQKERASIDKQKRQNKMLSEARTQQKKEKERRLEYVAKAEREEFDRILKVQRDAAAVEAEKERQKEDAKSTWRNDLILQIDKNAAETRQSRLTYLEEGRKLRKEINKEKAHLERIKERKLEELKNMKIPDKYLIELARHQVDF